MMTALWLTSPSGCKHLGLPGGGMTWWMAGKRRPQPVAETLFGSAEIQPYQSELHLQMGRNKRERFMMDYFKYTYTLFGLRFRSGTTKQVQVLSFLFENVTCIWHVGKKPAKAKQLNILPDSTALMDKSFLFLCLVVYTAQTLWCCSKKKNNLKIASF